MINININININKKSASALKNPRVGTCSYHPDTHPWGVSFGHENLF
ncbi:MAG: hypothetical protein ACI8P9_005092, partial [Parasphingorhabdus sp.]